MCRPIFCLLGLQVPKRNSPKDLQITLDQPLRTVYHMNVLRNLVDMGSLIENILGARLNYKRDAYVHPWGFLGKAENDSAPYDCTGVLISRVGVTKTIL